MLQYLLLCFVVIEMSNVHVYEKLTFKFNLIPSPSPSPSPSPTEKKKTDNEYSKTKHNS